MTQTSAHHFAILWASVANTVPASFWALYHLVSHPAALQVVRQEILDVLKLSGVQFGGDRDVMLSREQLDRLLYLGRYGHPSPGHVQALIGRLMRPSVHREQHQREPASVLCLHEHPRGSGGLQSAAGRPAFSCRQGGGHHHPLPSESSHGPRHLRGAAGTSAEHT